MEYAIAQLRHAYAQLKAGKVVNQGEFADGLIGPVITMLEEYQSEEMDIDEYKLKLRARMGLSSDNDASLDQFEILK